MKKVTDIKELKLIANTVRQDIIRMLTEAGSGHSAGSLGMADVFTALYFNTMDHDPKKPEWESRDRFVLSNGHICPVWYSALARAGYFPVEELITLRKMGTRLQGHPAKDYLPGVEHASGPLGQGISIAAGMALGLKMQNKTNTVFCAMGDGEIDEGQAWEAYMFAAKRNLNNLVVIIDRNYIQIDGNTEDVMPLDPLDKKFEAFNFHVISVDGNDMAALLKALKEAKDYDKGPVCVLANTVPGKGVSFMEGKYQWHGMPPNKDQAKEALAELEKERAALEGE